MIKTILLMLALTLASVVLWDHLKQIPGQFHQLNGEYLVAVFAGLVIYQIWNGSIWADVLGVMGYRASRKKCLRVWIESESMKWLPGPVWSYGARILSAEKLGVTKKTVSASLVLEVMLTNIGWGLLALTAFCSEPIMEILKPYQGWLWYLPVLLPLLIPMTIIARKKIDFEGVSIKRAGLVSLNYVILNFWNALMLWLMLQAIPGVFLDLVTTMALCSLAWLVGFWAIGVPGGIGVREAFIVLVLNQFGVMDSAILTAVLWRGLQVMAEMTGLLISISIGFFDNRQIKDTFGEREVKSF